MIAVNKEYGGVSERIRVCLHRCLFGGGKMIALIEPNERYLRSYKEAYQEYMASGVSTYGMTDAGACNIFEKYRRIIFSYVKYSDVQRSIGISF